MKLLLDENLSPRLVPALEPEYPSSTHVRTLGLRGATDGTIWELARRETYAIVSKARTLKARYGDHPVFWGGGVNTQQTLPFGTREEVRAEVLERCEIFPHGGGFVFNTIHSSRRTRRYPRSGPAPVRLRLR